MENNTNDYHISLVLDNPCTQNIIHNVLTAGFEFVAVIATVVDSVTCLLVVQQTFAVVTNECTI